MSTIERQDQNQLRRYVLGQLSEAEEEAVELRLLTDADFSEEMEIVADELVEQYAGEQVPEEERELVGRFISGSPERREKLRFAVALRRRAAEGKGRSHRMKKTLRLYLSAAAAALIVAGLGYAVWRGFFAHRDVDRGLAALRAAYGEQRPVEARLSGFDYAPSLRGEERVDSLRRDLAASLLTGAVVERPDAYACHALGQYYIAMRQYDRAIQQLKTSLDLDPQSAKAHNDLGVALFERGKQAKSGDEAGTALQDFGESLAHLRRAVEIDGSLLEARFNLALVLEEGMALWQPAEDAWRSYIERDAGSRWGAEARGHLRALEERRQRTGVQSGAQALQDFIDAYRRGDDAAAWGVLGRNREAIAGRFIPARLANAYLEAATGGRAEEAASVLGALDYAGKLEAAKGGDMYTAGVAHFYRSLPPNRRAALAEAYSLIGRGYDLCRRSDFAEAEAAFDGARRALAAAGDEAESSFVEYWVAYSQFHANRTDESLSASNALIRRCEQMSYKWLLAQALNLLSNIQTNFREQSAVLALTGRALTLSEQVGDGYGMQKHLASLAGKYGVLYNFPAALDNLAHCLLLTGDFWPGTRQAWRNYDTAAQVFDLMGLHAAAVAYAEEALRLAMEEPRDPSLIYLSNVRLGMAYAHLQNYDEGIRHARAGFAIGQSLTDGAAGQKIMAYSALQLGELYRQKGDLNEAALNYDRAVGLYDQLSFQAFAVVAHRGRLLTYLARGDDAAAGRELQVVLNLLEDYREKLKEEENRAYFFDVAQEVYDAAIDFTHSKVKDDEAAFGHSENSRARSLLTTMYEDGRHVAPNPEPRPYTVREIQERMPEQTQILQYAVLKDRLLIWVVSRTQFSVREQAIPRDTLNAMARDYLRLITSPASETGEVRRASNALYNVLITPVEGQLGEGTTLCVVADKILNHLSFAALASPTTGRYLIQSHALLSAPSSSIFVFDSDAARAAGDQRVEKLLSVGNPSFDRRAFPSLPDLPLAAAEAEAVARLYDTPQVLTGGDARKERVVRSIQESDVLHLASHYVVDERAPMRSQLLLAGDADGPGDGSGGSLLALDIYKMRLHRPRLAVLSACATGVGHYYDGEGMIGMARTFLAAGVPVVVASQWPVDSAATSELMVKFHGYRRRGGLPTAVALRAAQLDFINDPAGQYGHPYFWAPFVIVGGYSAF